MMTAAQHGNGFDPKRTKECVDRIEAIAVKKEAAHMAYMRECSVFSEDTKAVYDEAKTAWGIPKRALKTVIKVRATERKLEAMREDLETEDQESFDQIRHALGDLADTPLGGAALAGKEDVEDDVRSPAQKRRERERKDRDAALDAASIGGSGNGAETLATGLRALN
ncbi:hypothetical protein MKK84_32910 [Methylobacterium sp. E-065]|uniref:hypothetical protein n=1 Tax=Methylobacterium sp. E-065 TaxID=2836583 RepID=UPI001FBC0A0C|nr:hypothetical protein [Methylobacterium sp. E-065]MCJ2022150.1 hypothetical protein [Methylobacterium sp. E-065]